MTYYCKCGKTFTKNTDAGTTGNRMPDYGPGHECYGCPYICQIKTWDRMTQTTPVTNYECRMSHYILYRTTAALSLGDKCVGRIYSLDLDFLRRVRAFANTLDGIEPDRYTFTDRPADYCDDGRYKLTIYPTQNNKGIQAKELLLEQFFNPDGSRKDITPEAEKQLILDNIIKMKEDAQSMINSEAIQSAEEFRGTRYSDGQGKVYHVGPCENNKYRVFLGFDWDRNHEAVIFGGIPKCDEPWIAQKMLDEYAAKHGFEAIPEPDEQPMPDYDTTVPPDYEADEMEQPEDVDIPEGIDDDVPPNEDEADLDDDMDETNGAPIEAVAGECISLSDDLFYEFINACDAKINSALRVLLESRQKKFDFTAKITFERVGDKFVITHETGYKFEPINYKDKQTLCTDIQITLDENGNPVIPYDRERQLTFDDVAENSLKVTVDSKSGLVEKVESAGQLEFGDPADADDTDDAVHPCDNIDCPFWGLNDNHDAICCFEPGGVMDSDYLADLTAAVAEHNCNNDRVIEKYKAVMEGE